jgi:hypothetical protein
VADVEGIGINFRFEGDLAAMATSEDVHHAFPYRLAFECFEDGRRLRQRGTAMVEGLNCVL